MLKFGRGGLEHLGWGDWSGRDLPLATATKGGGGIKEGTLKKVGEWHSSFRGRELLTANSPRRYPVERRMA